MPRKKKEPYDPTKDPYYANALKRLEENDGKPASAQHRPKDYHPIYSQKLWNLFDENEDLVQTFAELCGHIKLSKRRGHLWVKDYPDFEEVILAFRLRHQIFYEKANRRHALTGKGSSSSIQFGLMNVARDEYTRHKTIEATVEQRKPATDDVNVDDWSVDKKRQMLELLSADDATVQ